jgi:hypothetical protein
MIFLFEKALQKKGCHALCSRMIQFCDFWKTAKPSVLKIFMTFLSDFCKLYPAYFRNTQNLFDEIGQILVQKKIVSLQNSKTSLENLKPIEEGNENKIISEEDALRYGRSNYIINQRNQGFPDQQNQH